MVRYATAAGGAFAGGWNMRRRRATGKHCGTTAQRASMTSCLFLTPMTCELEKIVNKMIVKLVLNIYKNTVWLSIEFSSRMSDYSLKHSRCMTVHTHKVILSPNEIRLDSKTKFRYNIARIGCYCYTSMARHGNPQKPWSVKTPWGYDTYIKCDTYIICGYIWTANTKN